MTSLCFHCARLACVRAAKARVRGFTLVELVMVIVIVGVIAVVALPRLMDSKDFTQRGFRDETMALLRYAQKTAIAQRRTVCVTVQATGLELRIFADNPAVGVCADAPLLQPPSAVRGGVGLSATPSSFQFTPEGRTDQASAVTLSVQDSTTITVEASTGYVHE